LKRRRTLQKGKPDTGKATWGSIGLRRKGVEEADREESLQKGWEANNRGNPK